jgi:DNA-directed RNA polymerase subunit RPC12/RpoP
MGKLALWVRCKACGREFDTRMRLDRKSYERGTLAANYHRCPHCEQRLMYRKVEYLTKDEPLPGRRADTG